MLATLTEIAIDHSFLIYLAVLITTIFEGPIISVFSGIMLKLGLVKLLPVALTIIAGDLIGDVLWYLLGRNFGIGFVYKYGKYVNLSEDHVRKVSKIFNANKYKILLGSKLTSGLGFAPTILFVAGLSKIPFQKYFFINLAGQLIWSTILLSTGFFFSHWYGMLNSTFQKISLVSFLIIVAILIVRYGAYQRNKIQKDYLQ